MQVTQLRHYANGSGFTAFTIDPAVHLAFVTTAPAAIATRVSPAALRDPQLEFLLAILPAHRSAAAKALSALPPQARTKPLAELFADLPDVTPEPGDPPTPPGNGNGNPNAQALRGNRG